MSAPTAGRRVPVRFAAVGVVNTLIDFALFLGLSLAGAPVLLANTVSTSAGLGFSYFANRRFTFGQRGRHDPRRAVLFVVVTGVGLWVLQPLVILAVRTPMPVAWTGLAATALAKAAAILVGMAWNFAWYRLVVFRPSTAR